MTESITIAIIGVVGSLLGAVLGGLVQRGTTPLSHKWIIAFGAIGGLLIGAFTAYWFVRPQPDINNAKGWPTIFLDTFSGQESESNWSNVKRTGVVTTKFDKTFSINVETGGKAIYVFPRNEKVVVNDQFLISMEAIRDAQSGCDYGITFRNNIKDEYYSNPSGFVKGEGDFLGG